jgi:hypothetical protein
VPDTKLHLPTKINYNFLQSTFLWVLFFNVSLNFFYYYSPSLNKESGAVQTADRQVCFGTQIVNYQEPSSNHSESIFSLLELGIYSSPTSSKVEVSGFCAPLAWVLTDGFILQFQEISSCSIKARHPMAGIPARAPPLKS